MIQVASLQGNQRVDREYYEQAQQQAAARAASLLQWREDFYSGSGNGMWGLVDAVQQCKAARSVSRIRGFTRLKPAQLAKKAARIEHKRQQQMQK